MTSLKTQALCAAEVRAEAAITNVGGNVLAAVGVQKRDLILSEAWKRRGEARGGILTWIQRWSLEKSRFGRGGGSAEAIDFQTNKTFDMALVLPSLVPRRLEAQALICDRDERDRWSPTECRFHLLTSHRRK